MNTLTPAKPAFPVLPRFDGGTLTALKWLALALMTVDHIDAFLYGRELATQVGRLVFPIFAVIVGYNLARPTLDAAGRRRLLRRLLAFGLLALPFHAELTGAPYPFPVPLNILFTFAAVVAVVHALEARQPVLAVVLFALGGAVVEYGWPGLALGLSVWWLYRNPPSWERAGLVLLATFGLVLANGTHTALLALPVLLLASRLHLRLPRCRWAFYGYYSAHLAVLWLVANAERLAP